MPDPAVIPNPAASIAPSAAQSAAGALPEIASSLSGVEIVSKLDAAARRGKLPGFHKGEGDVLFRLTDFGTPFESILEARTTPSGSGSVVRFVPRLKPTMPWIFVVTMIVSIWPGVWLTDSMLRTYFASYPVGFWVTCIWYLPLTIIPTPFAILQAIRKSRASAHAEALSLIEKIRTLIGAPAAPTTAA
jgi:hypothetical protein